MQEKTNLTDKQIKFMIVMVSEVILFNKFLIETLDKQKLIDKTQFYNDVNKYIIEHLTDQAEKTTNDFNNIENNDIVGFDLIRKS